jgi:hypothetical protein
MENDKNRWKAMFKIIWENFKPEQKRTLASQLDVSLTTIARWISGENEPRSDQVVRDLADAVPSLRSALQAAFPSAFIVDLHDQQYLQIPAAYARDIVKSRARTAATYTEYAITRDVYQKMASQLSSGLEGFMVLFSQCIKYENSPFVTALRVQVPGYGTGIWKRQATRGFYLSNGSLSGICVSENRPAFYPEETAFTRDVPLIQVNRIKSAGAFPVTSRGKIAGALIVATTEETFFSNARREIIEDYADFFALALLDHQFYDSKEIDLQDIPSLSHEMGMMKWFRHRIGVLQKEYPEKPIVELEEMVMGELDE